MEFKRGKSVKDSVLGYIPGKLVLGPSNSIKVILNDHEYVSVCQIRTGTKGKSKLIVSALNPNGRYREYIGTNFDLPTNKNIKQMKACPNWKEFEEKFFKLYKVRIK